MSSIIIESRQTTGSLKEQGVNGQYTTNIKAPITIEDGDSIQVRNVFIDSVDQASTIPVLSDTTLTMKYITFATLNTDTELLVSAAPPADNVAYANNKVYFAEFYGRYAGLTEAERNVIWNRTSNLLLASPHPIGDGFQYCATVKSAADATHQQVQSITIYKNTLGDKNWGGNTLTWFYENTAGQRVSYKMHVPILTTEPKYTFNFPPGPGGAPTGPVYLIGYGFHLYGPDHPWDQSNPNFNMAKNVTLARDEGGMNIVPPVGFKSGQAGQVPATTSTAAQVGESYTPVVHARSITIKAGNYNPSVLSNIISRKFNACIGNLLKDTSWLINEHTNTSEEANPNIFPTLFQDLSIGALVSEGGDDANNLFIASIDDSNIIGTMWSRRDWPGLIGGCANFEIDFDNDTQTFKMPKLHTEYYYNAATGSAPPQFVEGVAITQLGVPLKFAPGYPNPPNYTTNSAWTSINYDRGCMLITELSSSRADGVASNFWFNELGFSPTIQCPIHSTFTEANSYTIDAAPAANPTARHVPVFGFSQLNMGEQRTAPYLTPEFLLPELKTTLDYNITNQVNANKVHPIEAGDTTAIFGVKTLASILARDAYFKIVINGVPSNRLHSKDSVEFISSIVSKYYSGQNYTNGFATDSIVYVHSGAPIQLSAFDINIYNSDSSPAVIGADNSIFLEITKAKPDGLD